MRHLFVLIFISWMPMVLAQEVPVRVDTVLEGHFLRGYQYHMQLYALEDLSMLRDSLPADHPAMPYLIQGDHLMKRSKYVLVPSMVATGVGAFMLVQYYNRNVRYPDETNLLPASNAWLGGSLLLLGGAGITTSFVIRRQAKKEYLKAVESFVPSHRESRFEVSVAASGAVVRWTF
jgi:hypothetical protein